MKILVFIDKNDCNDQLKLKGISQEINFSNLIEQLNKLYAEKIDLEIIDVDLSIDNYKNQKFCLVRDNCTRADCVIVHCCSLISYEICKYCINKMPVFCIISGTLVKI